MEQQEVNEMVKKAYVEEVTQRTQEALAVLKNIRDTAAMLGPDVAAELEKDLARGVPVTMIQRGLLDKMGVIGKEGATATHPRMADITDEEFYAGLTDPVGHDLGSTPQPKAASRSFRDVSDDDFFDGLKTPVEHRGG